MENPIKANMEKVAVIQQVPILILYKMLKEYMYNGYSIYKECNPAPWSFGSLLADKDIEITDIYDYLEYWLTQDNTWSNGYEMSETPVTLFRLEKALIEELLVVYRRENSYSVENFAPLNYGKYSMAELDKLNDESDTTEPDNFSNGGG